MLAGELNLEVSEDLPHERTNDVDTWRAGLEKLGYLFNGLPSNPRWNLTDHQMITSLLKFTTQEARILSDL